MAHSQRRSDLYKGRKLGEVGTKRFVVPNLELLQKTNSPARFLIHSVRGTTAAAS